MRKSVARTCPSRWRYVHICIFKYSLDETLLSRECEVLEATQSAEGNLRNHVSIPITLLPPLSKLRRQQASCFQLWETGSRTPNKVYIGDALLACGDIDMLGIWRLNLSSHGSRCWYHWKYPRRNRRKLPEASASLCPGCPVQAALSLALPGRALGLEQEMWAFSTHLWQMGGERSKAGGSLTSVLVFRLSDWEGNFKLGMFFPLVFHL